MTSESLVITGGEAWEKWDEKCTADFGKFKATMEAGPGTTVSQAPCSVLLPLFNA